MSGMVSPVQGVVSCEWRGYNNHAGMDIACPTGTRVYAAFGGTVMETTPAETYGTGRSGIPCRIKNADGESQYYGHLSKVLVKRGDVVKAGQLIALSGATGNVTGPHLHFECWAAGGTYYNGLDRNPRTYFAAHGITPGSAPAVVVNTANTESVGSYYTRAIDGDISGFYSGYAMQRFLADRGYYTRELDGHWGAETTKGLQRWLSGLGTYTREIDGEMGPLTVKALQASLTTLGLYDRAVDGDLGIYTKKAIQRLLSGGGGIRA